jgi:hypothetical protein
MGASPAAVGWLSRSAHPVKIAQKQLGYASITTTLNIYTHAVDASHQKAIEAVERVLFDVRTTVDYKRRPGGKAPHRKCWIARTLCEEHLSGKRCQPYRFAVRNALRNLPCQIHKLRNVLEHLPERHGPG